MGGGNVTLNSPKSGLDKGVHYTYHVSELFIHNGLI